MCSSIFALHTALALLRKGPEDVVPGSIKDAISALHRGSKWQDPHGYFSLEHPHETHITSRLAVDLMEACRTIDSNHHLRIKILHQSGLSKGTADVVL